MKKQLGKESGSISYEKRIVICDECESLFFSESSKMSGLCPECAHILYGYPNCAHDFRNGRCLKCYWDGSESDYIKFLKYSTDYISKREVDTNEH